MDRPAHCRMRRRLSHRAAAVLRFATARAVMVGKARTLRGGWWCTVLLLCCAVLLLCCTVLLLCCTVLLLWCTVLLLYGAQAEALRKQLSLSQAEGESGRAELRQVARCAQAQKPHDDIRARISVRRSRIRIRILHALVRIRRAGALLRVARTRCCALVRSPAPLSVVRTKVRAAAAEAHAAAEQHARRVEELERQLGMAAERSDHTVRCRNVP